MINKSYGADGGLYDPILPMVDTLVLATYTNV